MYKQSLDIGGTSVVNVIRLSDGLCIPLNPGNADYQKFKVDIAAGGALLDPLGVSLTSSQVKSFMGSLP